MRVLIGVLLLLAGVRSPVAAQAVIPNCCEMISSLNVVNAATGAAERSLTIPGSIPGGVALVLSPNGKVAYSLGQTGLASVNVASGAVLHSIAIPEYASGMAIDPAGRYIYVSYNNGSPSYIEQIRAADLGLVKSVPAPTIYPNGLLVSPDGTRLYTQGYEAASVFTLPTLGPLASVTTAGVITGMGIAPDGGTLYLGTELTTSTGVTVVDTHSVGITAFITTPCVPDGNLAVSLDDLNVYFGCPGQTGGSLAALNLATLTTSVVNTTYPEAYRAILSPDGSRVFFGPVLSLEFAAVLVYDTQSQSQTATYQTLGYAQIALGPSGTELYETVQNAAPLSLTQKIPSLATVRTVSAAPFLGSGSYDPNDHLVLLPDSSGRVESFDSRTLAFKNYFAIPNLDFYVVYGDHAAWAVTGSPFGQISATVVKFDPVTQQILGTVVLPVGIPFDFLQSAFSSDGKLLFVPIFPTVIIDSRPEGIGTVTNAVAVISTAEPKLLNMVETGYISGVAVSPDGSRFYIAEGGVYAFDTATGALIISAAPAGDGLDYSDPVVSPDGSTLYVFAYGVFYALNTSDFSVKATASNPNADFGSLKITADGAYLYALGAELDIISTSTLQVVNSVPVVAVPNTGYVVSPPILIGR